jgi:abortive infection bacteriophage resistance protein
MMSHFELKPPTTFDQQIEILKSRGIVINDSSFARAILERLNYYRFSAYCLPFKKADECYEYGTTFEKVYKIYEFDRKLRNLIYYSIGPIEISFRTKIAYYHAHILQIKGRAI